MNRKTFYILLSALFLFSVGCSDDFLNRNPGDVMMMEETLLISSHDSVPLFSLNLPDAGSADYYITVFPKWMVFDSMHGKFENGTTTRHFTVEEPEWRQNPDFLTGTVVLNISGKGMVGFNAVYGNIGNIPGQLSPDIMGIEGSVTDAIMLKPKGIMVIATRNPDRLLVFNMATEVVTPIKLDKSPEVIDFCDNGNALLVASGNPEVTKIDLVSGSVLKTYPLDCIPFDLAAFDNGWCYISPAGNNWDKLRNLNLVTGSLSSSTEPWVSPMHGNTLLKKAVSKQLLMATRPTLGPTGLLRFDISRGRAGDTITYWHKNVEDFWISDDGSRFITKDGTLYPVPDYVPTTSYFLDLPQSGKLTLQKNGISYIDFPAAGNFIFVANGSDWQPGGTVQNNWVILQYNATSLNLVATYSPSFTVISQNNSLVMAHSEIKYLFSDNTGKKLFSIRRIAPEFGVEEWSMERFEVR